MSAPLIAGSALLAAYISGATISLCTYHPETWPWRPRRRAKTFDLVLMLAGWWIPVAVTVFGRRDNSGSLILQYWWILGLLVIFSLFFGFAWMAALKMVIHDRRHQRQTN